MMIHVLFFSGLVAAAACFALIEIQIEGPAGWAQQLPTWRIRSAWYDKFFPGRPLTGYHLGIMTFIGIVAHLPFAFGLPWTSSGELRSIAFVLLFWVLEDFLWFALNPHYGLRRFRPQHIPWHARAWWWIAPRDYWIATAIGVALYLASRPETQIYVALKQ